MEQGDFHSGGYQLDDRENDYPSESIVSIPHKRKRTLPAGRRLVAGTIIGIGVTLVFSVFFLMTSSTRCYPFVACSTSSDISQPAPISEILTVPYDKLEATSSVHRYRGQVTLVIRGTGKAAGASYSDAFYLYSDDNGVPYKIPFTEAFDLEIDGQRAIVALGLRHNPPAYSAQHEYTVTYEVVGESRPIQFRISDGYVADNAGTFQISIYEGAHWQPYRK